MHHLFCLALFSSFCLLNLGKVYRFVFHLLIHFLHLSSTPFQCKLQCRYSVLWLLEIPYYVIWIQAFTLSLTSVHGSCSRFTLTASFCSMPNAPNRFSRSSLGLWMDHSQKYLPNLIFSNDMPNVLFEGHFPAQSPCCCLPVIVHPERKVRPSDSSRSVSDRVKGALFLFRFHVLISLLKSKVQGQVRQHISWIHGQSPVGF